MPSPNLPLGPDEFAQGVVRYSDVDPSQQQRRMIVPVTFGDTVTTFAIIDTGSPWCVLGPDDAKGLTVGYRIEEEGPQTLWLRGGYKCTGWLYRIPVSLEAEEGTGITIEALVFIPKLDASQEWFVPNFLGLDGFLERIRFAVDPEHNLFYFGAL